MADILQRTYAVKDNVLMIPFRDEGLQILAYGREFVFRGQIAKLLIPCLAKHLDGHTKLTEVCAKVIAELGESVTNTAIVQTIQAMEKKSLVREVIADASGSGRWEAHREQMAFFGAFENQPDKFQAQLEQSHLGIVVVGEMVAPMWRAIQPLGIGKTTFFSHQTQETLETMPHQPLEKIELNYLRQLIAEHKITHLAGVAAAITHQLWDHLNAISLELDIPMTRLEVTPLKAELGPTVLPRRTACYHCFSLRRQSLKVHFEEYRNLAAHLDCHSSLPPFAIHPLFREMSASLLGYEVMRVISGYFYPQTYNQIVVMNFFNLELEKHTLLKIPRCPACSMAEQQPKREMYQKLFRGEQV